MLSYTLLRETADLVDEDDFVLTQVDPPALVELPRGFLSAAEGFEVAHIEFMIEWIDVSGDPVLTTRGTFDLAVVRKTDRPAPLTGSVLVDSTTIAGQAYRPIAIDEIIPGDEFNVRLTNMVPPATTTNARIYWRGFIK